MKDNHKLILFCLLAFIAGAIASDYYNMRVAKWKNYSKIGGIFKYTAKDLI